MARKTGQLSTKSSSRRRSATSVAKASERLLESLARNLRVTSLRLRFKGQMIHTSIVRVHQHGACITRNRRQSMGRSRGGLTGRNSCGGGPRAVPPVLRASASRSGATTSMTCSPMAASSAAYACSRRTGRYAMTLDFGYHEDRPAATGAEWEEALQRRAVKATTSSRLFPKSWLPNNSETRYRPIAIGNVRRPRLPRALLKWRNRS